MEEMKYVNTNNSSPFLPNEPNTNVPYIIIIGLEGCLTQPTLLKFFCWKNLFESFI